MTLIPHWGVYLALSRAHELVWVGRQQLHGCDKCCVLSQPCCRTGDTLFNQGLALCCQTLMKVLYHSMQHLALLSMQAQICSFIF